MKTPSLIALALAFALASPVLAQDSSSQPQTPPATSSAQTNSSSSTAATQAAPASDTQQRADQNSQKADQLQPLTYQKHEGFWGHLNPFARKKYVKRQLQPMQDRLNELDELTSSNAKLMKDVDARATQGIQMASAKATEADQHAVDAGNRAQLANQTATDANNRLQTVQKSVQNIDQYQTASQVEIRFRPGQQFLSKKAKDALDQMATPLKDQKGYIVEVQSFSAGRGQAAIQNSQLMADAVSRYLILSDDIPVYRIYKVGMGNAPLPSAETGKAQRLSGGRVEISLLKNGIGDLTPAPVAGGGVNGNLPQSDQGTAQTAPNSSSKPVNPQPQQAPQSPQQPQ